MLSSTFKRCIYYGALNGPQVKFVPVPKSQRPPLFTAKGLNERAFRFRMKLQTAIGLYQLWKLTPQFDLEGLKCSLVKVYGNFLRAIERNNRAELLETATPHVYESLKGKRFEGYAASAARRFVLPPKLVSIVPIQIQGAQKVRIFQITLFLRSESDSPASGTYIVFEYCPDVYRPRWRVCGQIHESDEYYQDN